ncbi:maleylpyruvate isomerase N-terminal domain-containing protein [Streptomyces coeruleorubidus]|uniref:maleylpyruvate isomerase N-terminal domain-containing protein n=1 Tax=Streptomyces coeruleorubidus TaxID=116188 RepID=UPI0037B28444
MRELTDSALARPLHLPGWIRAHVIAHVARNATPTRSSICSPGPVQGSRPPCTQVRAGGRARSLRTDRRGRQGMTTFKRHRGLTERPASGSSRSRRRTRRR